MMLGSRAGQEDALTLGGTDQHSVLQARFLHQEIQRSDVGRDHDSAIVGPDPRQALGGRPLRRFLNGPAGQAPCRADQQCQQGRSRRAQHQVSASPTHDRPLTPKK